MRSVNGYFPKQHLRMGERCSRARDRLFGYGHPRSPEADALRRSGIPARFVLFPPEGLFKLLVYAAKILPHFPHRLFPGAQCRKQSHCGQRCHYHYKRNLYYQCYTLFRIWKHLLCQNYPVCYKKRPIRASITLVIITKKSSVIL